MGCLEGFDVGCLEGLDVGCLEGFDVGCLVGCLVGDIVGWPVGRMVAEPVRCIHSMNATSKKGNDVYIAANLIRLIEGNNKGFPPLLLERL